MPSRRDDWLAAYVAHLRAERHASPHTIRGYLSDLRQLLAVAGAGGVRAVRAETLRHWLRTLDGTAERTSIARKLAALDWEHVDTDAGLLRVLGKGRKERVVPVGRPALRALAAYRQACGARPGGHPASDLCAATPASAMAGTSDPPRSVSERGA